MLLENHYLICIIILVIYSVYAVLAELADAHGSGPCEETHGGSNPLDRTMYLNALYIGNTSFVTLNINRENNLTEELTATKFIERY